jgi:hypothetical protein
MFPAHHDPGSLGVVLRNRVAVVRHEHMFAFSSRRAALPAEPRPERHEPLPRRTVTSLGGSGLAARTRSRQGSTSRPWRGHLLGTFAFPDRAPKPIG